MATAARDVLLTEQLNEVESVVSVETRLIDAGPRLRPIDMVWAKALGELMLREGQRTPIDICVNADGTGFELAGAGGHRLAAAQLAGIEHLKAFVHSADLRDRRQREISENLWRRDLDPIDRAAFIAELVQLKRAKAGADRAAHRDASVPQHLKRRVAEEADTALETISNVYGFTDEIGEQLGLSGRTLRNDLLIYRGLAPSLVQRLRDVRHSVLTNASQLRALAKLHAADQERAVAILIGEQGDPAKSVSEALGRMRGANRLPTNPSDKRHSAFIGSFSRMSLPEKKGALQELAPLMPAGFKLIDPSQPTSATTAADDTALKALREHAKGALDAAFDLLNRLSGEGEAVEDEDIWDAHAKVQRALLGLNSGSPF
ncbi:ParB N-terminal domain-containing protein [Sphingomonas sp.]|uniref:ParB/RepB/Spo0J family partition protein n=1 Tax=Sphingomonas sp. TaxID=28214 RepID=UPI00307E8925